MHSIKIDLEALGVCMLSGLEINADTAKDFMVVHGARRDENGFLVETSVTVEISENSEFFQYVNTECGIT